MTFFKRIITWCYFLFFNLIITNLFSQNFSDVFLPPLDTPLSVSAIFGEIRLNHLHSGIDFKTGGVEGKVVHAVKDGYVARINIAPNGFGKTLYLAHPDGTMSVYAHLKEFTIQLEQFLNKEQYKQKSFEINFAPEPDFLRVCKGDVIGISGNSGSSGGPHLHFEMRNNETQVPFNPLIKLPIPDHINPEIQSIVIYPLDNKTWINEKNENEIAAVKKINGIYSLTSKIKVGGTIGIGIQTNDLLNSNSSTSGVYCIKLYCDSVLSFTMQIDRFAFDETRYACSESDNELLIENKKKVYKCFIEPNNKFSINKSDIKRGEIYLSGKKKRNIKIVVSDIAGNQQKIEFEIIPDTIQRKSIRDRGNIYVFPYQKANKIKQKGFEILFPENVFFDTVELEYSSKHRIKNAFSATHKVFPVNTPVFKKFKVSILCDSVPANLKSKLFIATFNGDKTPAYLGGEYVKGWVTAQINQFGNYCIMMDTVCPAISLLNGNRKGDFSNENSIQFLLKDDFSGIASYEGTIDGRWVLFEFDPKSGKAEYYFDDSLPSGSEHHLIFKVTDNRNNSKTYEQKITRVIR